MADVEDVSDSLVGVIAGCLSGNTLGVQIDIFSGWPLPNELKAALAAGGVQISVYPMAGASADKTRHQRDWERLTASAVTTTATIAGSTITFGGTITLPLNVSVVYGLMMATYSAVSGETLTSLAANVAAALAAAGVPASAGGAAITLAGGLPVSVSLGGQAMLIRENAREDQVFQITVWAPSRDLRRATASAFESALMGIDRFTLSDGATANIHFMKSMFNDHSELEGCYRRDIWFRVEFPYTETAPAYDVVSVSGTVAPVTSPLNS